MAPSIENDIRSEAKERADDEAIKVFVKNLRQLLMESPLGQKLPSPQSSPFSQITDPPEIGLPKPSSTGALNHAVWFEEVAR